MPDELSHYKYDDADENNSGKSECIFPGFMYIFLHQMQPPDEYFVLSFGSVSYHEDQYI